MMKTCVRCGEEADAKKGFEHNRKVCRVCMRKQRNEIRWAKEARERWQARRRSIIEKYGVGEHGAKLGRSIKKVMS